MGIEHLVSSETLASLPSTRRDGRPQELRVCLDDCGRHKDVSIRLWVKGDDGVFGPKAGIGLSLRQSELSRVIDGLLEAERRLAE